MCDPALQNGEYIQESVAADETCVTIVYFKVLLFERKKQSF